MDIHDFRNILDENSPRHPVPGEVWRFDALEAHAISMTLDAIKPFMDEEDAESLMIGVFSATNNAYELGKKTLGEMPHGITLAPTPQDRGFFAALVATARWHLWCLPTKIENPDVGEGERKVIFELPCGHTPAEHETILRGWYDREIVQAKRFTATRRAIESLPAEKRIMGKKIIARSDLEREIKERVQSELERGLYSPQLTEELITEIMIETDQTRQQAEGIVARMREAREREMIEELTELAEAEYKVIEGF